MNCYDCKHFDDRDDICLLPGGYTEDVTKGCDWFEEIDEDE